MTAQPQAIATDIGHHGREGIERGQDAHYAPAPPQSAARLGGSDLQHLQTLGGRLFETEAATPCRVNFSPANDLWFSPFRDRERAARQCLGCPFLGRCGFNAVISRATHGVWGGQILPGDKPGELEPIYARLLEQFEQRRAVELGDTPAPPLPTQPARRRRPRGATL